MLDFIMSRITVNNMLLRITRASEFVDNETSFHLENQTSYYSSPFLT